MGLQHPANWKLGALQHPEAAPVEQGGHQLGRPVEAVEDRLDLLAGEHHGKPFRLPGMDEVVQPRQRLAQDGLVQEEEGAQCLVLGRGSQVRIHSQGRQKLGDLDLAHLGGVPLAVEEDEPLGTGR